LSLMATTYLSALGAGAGASAHRTAATVASVAVGAVVFTFAFRVSTGRDLTVRQVLPGALLATASWTLLQMFGATYVAHVVRHASATNSVFALVLGLIAFIYLASVSLVFCVEINVVRVDQLHPRALLTPFTDDVDLTAGDRRSYTDQAEAQRSKGFERIMVTFGRRPRR
jgi:membrane protein